MSDAKSSLPVRTQNNGDVVINIADGTTETQLLSVDASGRLSIKLYDGSGNAITSQASGAQRALDVGINVAGVQVDPRSIRSLTSADVVSTVQSTSPWVTQDKADGSVTGGTAGTYSLLAGGQYNSTLPTLTTGQQAALQVDSSGRLIMSPTSSTVTANQGTANTVANAWPVKITDGTNTAGVAAASTAAVATQPAEVVALSPNTPLPAGTNALGSVLANLQVASAAVSVTNPVPVTVTSASSGTPIQGYLTSAALAAGSSVTLTYTVPASHTFSLERIWCSSAVRVGVQVQWGASGSPTTTFQGFNSSANPNIDIVITAPPTLIAAEIVNVIFTNNDTQPSNVYATVEGNQIS